MTSVKKKAPTNSKDHSYSRSTVAMQPTSPPAKRRYSAEEKVRIVLKGLKATTSVGELCRQEGIDAELFYAWRKVFPEAGRKRLEGKIQSTPDAISNQGIKSENDALKQLVAELSLENRELRKGGLFQTPS